MPDTRKELSALLNSAGLAPLDDIGWLRVTGSDRVRWLNGMVTNSIQSLAPGEGNYNFLLNAQGRIQGDLTAYLTDDSILLRTSRTQLPTLTPLLDRYIIMDDVELTDLTPDLAALTLIGPQAAALLTQIGLPAGTLTPIHLITSDWHGSPITLTAEHGPLVPRFELWAAPATIKSLRIALLEAGAIPTSPEALEQLRILSATPRYGTDIRNADAAKDLPQETNQTHALHFNKGCYLGQEIVERIRSRGQVHRTLTLLELTGPVPVPGTPIEARIPSTADPKPIGEITSAALIDLPDNDHPNGPITLALAYLRREALEIKAPLTYPNGTASPYKPSLS